MTMSSVDGGVATGQLRKVWWLYTCCLYICSIIRDNVTYECYIYIYTYVYICMYMYIYIYIGIMCVG